MEVTWTTFDKTQSTVEYSLHNAPLFEMTARGNTTLFVDSGQEKRWMFIHRVTLTDLKPAATYGVEGVCVLGGVMFSFHLAGNEGDCMRM